MGAGAGLVAGAAAQFLTGEAAAAGAAATLDQLKRAERDPNHRILLKGGMVLSLDPAVGDFESGDVLIGGKKILAVGRSLNATASGVDASGMIVMPGFVDTHHHQYETILRGILADGVLGSPNDGKKTYQGVIQGIFTPVYQPEDGTPGKEGELGRPSRGPNGPSREGPEVDQGGLEIRRPFSRETSGSNPPHSASEPFPLRQN
jgi:hypothetical protein